MDFPELDFTFDGVRATDLGLVASKSVNLHPAAPNVTWATPDYGEPVDTSRFVAGRMTYGLVDDEYADFWVMADDFEGRQAAWRWLVANVHGADAAMTCSLFTADDGRALEWYGTCSVEDVSADPGTLEKVRVSWQRRPYRRMPDGTHTEELAAEWPIDVGAATFEAADGRAVTSAAAMLGELWVTCPDGTLWSTADGLVLVRQAAEPMGPGVRIAADGGLAVLWSELGAWWSRDMAEWREAEGLPVPLESAAVVDGVAAFAGPGGLAATRDFEHWARAVDLPAEGVSATCRAPGARLFACPGSGGTLVLATRDAGRSFAESALPVAVESMCAAGGAVVAVGEGRSFVTFDMATWAEGSSVGDARAVVGLGDRAVAVGSTFAVSSPADGEGAHMPIERTAVLSVDTDMCSEVSVEGNYAMSATYRGETAELPPGAAVLPWPLGHGRHEILLRVPYQPAVWSPLADEPADFPSGAWWRYRAMGEQPEGWEAFARPPAGCEWRVLQEGGLVCCSDLVALPPWGTFSAFEPSDELEPVPNGARPPFAPGLFWERQSRVRVAFRWERGCL
ncbi:hypothetical protein [Adlercreutzia mucosicola]|uniref:hypothetical protein n=3 Tax=Adlercreutzia mucosicola TaxID=580026 RepID=UPI00041695A0|nr:hypothetical protein [Adlercreutzia mucosicola]